MKFKVLLINLVFYLNLFAQINYKYPKIIYPSPLANSFTRYGEIPIDFSTGIPKIEIPIYTIKGKKLSLPISISYHGSGIKVNDIASEMVWDGY